MGRKARASSTQSQRPIVGIVREFLDSDRYGWTIHAIACSVWWARIGLREAGC